MNCCSSLEFLGDYEIKIAEMIKGTEILGEARIRLLIDNEEHEMLVGIREGKKEGVGLIVREDGTVSMQLMFVNDECEGEVVKMDRYGRAVLKGRVSKGKEVGIWIEYDDSGAEIWRGSYRHGRRDVTLEEVGVYKRCSRELGERSIQQSQAKKHDCDDKQLHIWRWNKGKRFESEFRGLNPMNAEELMRRSNYHPTRCNNRNDPGVSDTDCLGTIEVLEIVWDVTMEKPRIMINGSGERKGVSIDTFTLYDDARGGIKFVIRNCDRLREVYIGMDSLVWYNSFELKNLPSLVSIVFCDWVFCNCQSMVFESMNG